MMMVNLYDQTKTGCQSLYRQLSRTKHVTTNNNEILDTQLNRCLDTFSITLLGIGHMVGVGVYVLSASIAKDVAGPSIVVSYTLAGFASLLSALCYSEFAVKLPRAGSAYSYAYIALGEFFAFIVGWSLILENCIGIAAISRSCSGYFDSLLDRTIQNHTIEFIQDNITTNPSFQHLDFLAVLIVFLFVGFLTFGIKVTSYINNVLSIVNIFVIFIVVIVGSFYADLKNWNLPGKGFAPHGWHGIFSASASCFYAYIGFDSIATSGEEAKNPQKSIPIATFISMCFATIAYVSVSAVLTLMVPFNELNNESGLPDALGRFAGAQWAKYLVICGASCGMISVLIGTMYSLTRIVYAMASDGLLYPWMGEVNQKTQIPLKAMYFFAIIGAVLAFSFELTMLVEMMSIGTLLAYLVVSASVIVARYQPSDESNKHQMLENEEDEAPGVRCTDEQELSEMTNGTSKKPAHPTDSNRSSSSSEMNGEFRDVHASRFMTWLLKYDWLYRKCISLQDLRRELITFQLKKYPVGSSKVHLPTVCVFVMTALIFLLCSLGPQLIELATTESAWYALIILVLALTLAFTYTIIALHEQNTAGLRYKVPCVPFIPTLSILFTGALMTNLNKLTWIRLVIWMIVGFFIYFAYGIKNSTLNPESKSVKKEYRSWGSIDSDSDKNPVIASDKADF